MSNKTLMKIMGFVAAAAGIAVCCMMFIPAITTGGNNPTTYTGMNLAFGKVEVKLGDYSYGWQFSFGVLLAYVLPIASLVLMLLCVLGNKNGIKFILGCVSFACFVVSIILLITARNMAVYHDALGDYNATGYDMAIGLILAIVFAAVGALTSGTYTCLQLLKSSKSGKKHR